MLFDPDWKMGEVPIAPEFVDKLWEWISRQDEDFTGGSFARAHLDLLDLPFTAENVEDVLEILLRGMVHIMGGIEGFTALDAQHRRGRAWTSGVTLPRGVLWADADGTTQLATSSKDLEEAITVLRKQVWDLSDGLPLRKGTPPPKPTTDYGLMESLLTRLTFLRRAVPEAQAANIERMIRDVRRLKRPIDDLERKAEPLTDKEEGSL